MQSDCNGELNKFIKSLGFCDFSQELIDIAYDLSTSSTNQRQALVNYLQTYNVGSNIHDETFYDYIVDNYSEIIDD